MDITSPPLTPGIQRAVDIRVGSELLHRIHHSDLLVHWNEKAYRLERNTDEVGFTPAQIKVSLNDRTLGWVLVGDHRNVACRAGVVGDRILDHAAFVITLTDVLRFLGERP